MAWGEDRPRRRTFKECPKPTCTYLVSAAPMSPRFCPTHEVSLVTVVYERVETPKR